MLNLLRLLYSLTAACAGISGLYSLRLWLKTPRPANQLLNYWFVLRGVLGLIQVPVHLLILLPARFSEPIAMRFVQVVLDNQPAVFYARLTACNYALLAMVGLGLFMYTGLLTLHKQNRALLASERFTLVVWSGVWILRMIASYLGVTKHWFHLAWPVDTIV